MLVWQMTDVCIHGFFVESRYLVPGTWYFIRWHQAVRTAYFFTASKLPGNDNNTSQAREKFLLSNNAQVYTGKKFQERGYLVLYIPSCLPLLSPFVLTWRQFNKVQQITV